MTNSTMSKRLVSTIIKLNERTWNQDENYKKDGLTDCKKMYRARIDARTRCGRRFILHDEAQTRTGHVVRDYQY